MGQNKKMKLFIGILDWGLGHATRCIPIIRLLLEKGHGVILGGEGRSLALLRHTFPDLTFVELPPYNIHYSSSSFQIPILLKQVPRLLRIFKEEHQIIEQLIDKHQISAIISDNRYGLWTKKVPTVYLTHQIAPLAPIRYLVYALQKRFIAKFGACWVLDFAQKTQQLAGSLAHKYPLPPNTHFIGTLSRFTKYCSYPLSTEMQVLLAEKIDILAILSGPEPQRSILSQKIKEQLAHLTQNVWIIEGKTEEKKIEKVGNITTISFLTENELWHLFQQQPILISRGGYSSLMDFAALGLQKCILVPTPGQTEQVYLAEYLAKQGKVVCVKQDEMNLAKQISQIPFVHGFEKWEENNLLENQIDSWLSTI